jgi:hypothetical protein
MQSPFNGFFHLSRKVIYFTANVDIGTLLICVEGTKTPQKCYRIFFVRGQIQGCNSKSCGRTGQGETPQAHKRRGGSPNRPRKAKCLERKATALL